MDDGVQVQVVERPSDRRQQSRRLAPMYARTSMLFERSTGNEIHHHVWRPLVVSIVDDADDVGVAQCSQAFLNLKPQHHAVGLARSKKLGPDDFDRYLGPAPQVG